MNTVPQFLHADYQWFKKFYRLKSVRKQSSSVRFRYTFVSALFYNLFGFSYIAFRYIY